MVLRLQVRWLVWVGYLTIGIASTAQAEVLLQSDSVSRFGEKPFSYFFIEAEDFHTNDPHGDGPAWLLSSDEDALLFTVNEEPHPDTGDPLEIDPGAFASGGESITNTIQSLESNNTGGGHDVQYQVQFDTAGSYHLYIRHHSPLGPELNRNRNDSFYYPVEFGEEPEQLKANGDDYGILESMEFPGDVDRRGPWVWFAARDDVYNFEQDPPAEQDDGTFLEFIVTERMLNEPMALEFDHREDGTMLDAFLFIESNSGLPPTGEGPDGNGFFGIGDAVDAEFRLANLGSEAPPGVPGDFDGDLALTAADIDALSEAIRVADTDMKFDLNGDSVNDQADRTTWVSELKNTYFGDSNLDGEFNSSDLVTIFSVGKFETGVAAGWGDGDWNGDGEFNSSDFVTAFGDGGFENGPRAATSAVPEPSTVSLLALAGLTPVGNFRRRKLQTT